MSTHAHEHDAHAGHVHAEPFPRLETVDLVARELAASRRRASWQVALAGIGAALLALGLPNEALFGGGWKLVERTSAGAWLGPHLVPCALARLLTTFGLASERAWFAISALGFGASAAALFAAAHVRGWTRTTALLAMVVAASAPVAWLAGTTPGATSFGLAGVALVVAAMGANDGRKLLAAWMLALLANGFCIVLWPAIAWSAAHMDRRASLRRSAAALAIALVVAAVVLVVGGHGLLAALETGASWNARLTPMLSSAWFFVLWPALGGAALGALEFLRDALRRGSVRFEPLGALALLAPLAGMASRHVDLVLTLAWIVPIAAVGVAQQLGRLARGGRAGAALAFTVALALTALDVALLAAHERFERPSAWQRAARRDLEVGDVLVTADRTHAYLARERFGLVAELATLPSAALQTLERLGARAVLDVASFGAAGEALGRAALDRKLRVLEVPRAER